MYNVIRFQIMSSFRSFLLMIVPADLIQPKHILHCLISSLHVFFVFTQQLEILMTVLPKDNDEHLCHFAMETPFGGGGGEVSGRILIKFDPGAPQLRTKVLSYSSSVSPSLHGTSKRGPGKVVASCWEKDTSVLSS